MSVRRSLVVLLIFLVLAPIAVFVRSQNQANGANTDQLKNLQLYQVGRGDVELSVSAIGKLDADQETDLSFLVTGRVTDIYVQRDDYVLVGDILARVDSTLQQLAYEQAILTLDQAEMTLRALMVVDEDQITVAQAAVDSARGAYYSIGNSVQPGDISAAQLAYDQALLTNNESILARDTAPPGQYDILAAQAGEASFNLEIARLQLEQLTTGSATSAQSGAAYARVLQAEQELERVEAGPSQVQIDAAQSQIDRATSQLKQAELSLSRTVLVAPYDGVIGTLNAEIGTLVAPSVPLITLVDISPLRLTVEVDEVDIRLIVVGLPVRVRLDALSDNIINASVTRISDAGTITGGIVTYNVEIELSDEDNRARVGMTADATIVIEQATDALFVPNSYIRLDRFTNEAFVNVLQEDNTVREVQVTLGLQGQESSEVRAGVDEGELMVIKLGGGGLNEVLGN